MKGFGRASGKVILLGEHAVVYGVPALVGALERGAEAEATLADADSIVLPDGPVPADHQLYLGLAALRESLESPPIHLSLRLLIRAGSGLGASACLGVAAARAIVAATGSDRAEADVARAALAWERVFHGNPSGVDIAAAVYGGILRHVRGEAPVPVPLPRPLPVAVCLAGPPAPTAEMVAQVAKLRESAPGPFEKNLEAIRSLVDNAIHCVRAGDTTGLGRLMDLNQMLLSSWYLSTPEIEHACRIARGAGALGAKLTGAGGGGAVIALGDTERIADAWQKEGLEAFVTHLGNPL